MADDSELLAVMKNLARDIKEIRILLTTTGNAAVEAESEVPEKMRRFTMYFHDIHDIKYIYEESGQPPPPYLLREMERCDDRMRHLVEELNAQGGTFEKVRREMTKQPNNRWDHTAMLPKGNSDETRPQQQQDNGDEGGTALTGGQS